MTTYRCRVSDSSGRVSELLREAASIDSAARELASEGWYPLAIQPSKREGRAKLERYPRATIIEFTDTLAVMIDSGLSVRDALEVAQSVFSSGKSKRLVDSIVTKIKKGASFYSVTEELAASFPPVYRGLVRIGERLGSLEGILKELSRYLNDDKKLKDKMAGSLLYPVLVLAVAIVGIVTIIVVVFPKIKAMLESLSNNSPAQIGHMLRNVTATLVSGGVVVALLGVAVAVLFALRKAGGSAALAVDRLLLKVPLAGGAMLKTDLFLFSFAMEILTANGVTVEDALAESASVLGSSALREGVLAIKRRIETGVHLSSAFAEERLFPQRIARWIAIGERVGSIDKVFVQLKSYYQTELEKWTTRFMSLIEPALIIFVGVLVMYMVLTFIVPIFNMFGNLLSGV